MTRAIILALLLPLAAHAQLALFAMNGSTEVPIGATLDLGKVAAGDILSIRIRLRNTGASTIEITSLFASNPEFTITAPSGHFRIVAGKVQDILLGFSSPALGPHSTNLQVNSDMNNISLAVSATVLVGPVLTAFTPCTGPDASLSIDFGRVQSGQLSFCTFYVQNPGTEEMAIQVTGLGFQGPTAPLTIAPGQTTAFVINFAPNAARSYTGALTIGPRTYALTGTAFDAPLPTPLLEFDSGPVQSSQQRRLTMRLPTASSITTSGFVNLAFLPDTTLVTDDPAVVFLATGTRSLPFSVSQGSTLISIGGQTSAVFQTGTSSGRIRFTLSGISMAGDPTTLLTIPASPISTDIATATRRTGNLDIQVIGFDNTYSAGTMTFAFLDTSGQTLPPGAIRADFTQDFRTFFTKTRAGSAFQVRVTFPVTGDTSGIGGVDVQLTNAAGTTTQRLNFQ